MTSNDYVTLDELKVLKRRAAAERARYFGTLVRAVMAAFKALASGAAPGGMRAAQ